MSPPISTLLFKRLLISLSAPSQCARRSVLCSRPTLPIRTNRNFATMTTLPGPDCRDHFRTFIETPEIYSFFEKQTSTWQYVVADPASMEAAIIDPVLDFDNVTGAVSTKTADCILDFISKKELKVARILETHAHADHLTAAQYLKEKLPGDVPLCIGKRITQVQKSFGLKYGMDPATLENAFDIYLEDDEEFKLGEISCKVMHLPGHTPDHVGYLLGKSVFTGDSIFLPDVGSARADFPGGSAKILYSSMQRLLSLPGDYKIFVGHDYPPEGREPVCVATVEEQKTMNKHGKMDIDESSFIKLREERDATLGAPRLLHPSLQVNIRAGKVPPLDADGQNPLKKHT
ncbi:Beta-lactamase hydrolase-like protein [Hypsizygus marmoreus]|uniref:Beta-lactamase hydrolase-like protein n=1 Tax=Hypsizygus marmoreus TaxID=39966 RepID=A0A369JBC4_HYPMA|nr:Beta-lactamase hydrolase-like protein [Hypsizygus marmoreus]